MPGTDRFSRYHNNFTDNKWMVIEKNYDQGSYIQGSYIQWFYVQESHNI